MPDLNALGAVIDALTPGERLLLEPLMRLEFPIPFDDPRVDRIPAALLKHCLTTGLLQQYPIIGHRDDPPELWTVPGIGWSLGGWAAWELWESRQEEGPHPLPEWLER